MHRTVATPPSTRRAGAAALAMLAIAAGSLWLPGCESRDPGPAGGGASSGETAEPTPEPGPPVDSDGDGLDDWAEAALGTRPDLDDTDGDGYPDGQEVLELGFDPATNPYRFNPRIADVPRLEVRIVSEPDVYLEMSTSDSQTRSFDNTTSLSESTSVASSVTNGSSLRTEVSNTVGGEVSYSMFGGLGGSANYSHSWSESRETTFSWTGTRSSENSRTLAETRGVSRSKDVTTSGARVEVAVDLVNAGHLAFSLQSIALGLRKLDPRTGAVVEIGQLEPESDRTFHDVTSLSPGERVRGLVFRAEIPLAKAELLLGEGPMAVRPVTYELLDENRRSFKHRYTLINGRTATVTVDRGEGSVPFSWEVATHTPDGEGLPLSKALSEVLRLPVTTGSTLWRYRDEVKDTKRTILSLDGAAADAAKGAYWVVQIDTDDGRGGRSETVHPLREDLDLDAIRLLPTKAVRLVYVVDGDRDGLGERAEMALGLDAHAFDTDGDGVGDGDELIAGTNPRHGLAKASILAIQGDGRTLQATVRARPAEGGRLAGVVVDWGDGTTPARLTAEDYEAADFTHAYTEYGDFEVRVTPADESVTDPARVRPDAARVRLAPLSIEAWSAEVKGLEAGQAVATPDGVYLLSQRTVGRTVHFEVGLVDEGGTPRWTKALGTQRREEQPWWGGSGYELIATDDAGTVYATDHDNLYALGADGEVKWSHAARILSIAATGKGTVFFTSPGNYRAQGSGVFIVRVDEGRETWKRFITLPKAHIPVPLTVLESGLLALGAEYVPGIASASHVSFVQVVNADGAPVRSFKVPGDSASWQRAAPGGGLLHAGFNGGFWDSQGPHRAGFWRHDAEGTLLWSNLAPPAAERSIVSALTRVPGRPAYVALTSSFAGRSTYDAESRVDLVRLDDRGTMRRERTIATIPPKTRFGLALAAQPDGSFYVVSSAPGQPTRVTKWRRNPEHTGIVERP